jgi:hypothetical protein
MMREPTTRVKNPIPIGKYSEYSVGNFIRAGYMALL